MMTHETGQPLPKKEWDLTDEEIQELIGAPNGEIEVLDPDYVAHAIAEARKRGL